MAISLTHNPLNTYAITKRVVNHDGVKQPEQIVQTGLSRRNALTTRADLKLQPLKGEYFPAFFIQTETGISELLVEDYPPQKVTYMVRPTSVLSKLNISS
jgi:hypothetical protein